MIRLYINTLWFRNTFIGIHNSVKQNVSMISGISVPVDAGLDELRLARQPGAQVSHSATALGGVERVYKVKQAGDSILHFHSV